MISRIVRLTTKHRVVHATSMRPVIGLVLAALMGCTNLTRVSAPDVTQPSALQNPAGALTYRAGSLAQFYEDVSTWAQTSGQLTDEFTTPDGSDRALDQRILPDGGGQGGRSPYQGQVTRVTALTAIGLLQLYNPQPPSRIGELFAALGTIETIMAEDLCSGVPLSTVVSGLPVAGPQVTTQALYHHALAQFDSAARYAGDNMRIANWAAVGRARALLDLDSIAAAAASVAAVPTGYSYEAQYAGALQNQQNIVAQQFLSPSQNLSVSDREGENGLNFVTAKDSRVRVDSLAPAPGAVLPATYIFLPDTSLASPIPIATGIEARLIEAEAALATGDAAGWAAKLNALRADSAETGVRGLPALTADSTTAASHALQIAVMFRERAFWLFATGHRQGDLRRLIRQYGFTQAQVFPTGLYQSTGLRYGSDITFPLVGEKTDPQAPECLDRNP